MRGRAQAKRRGPLSVLLLAPLLGACSDPSPPPEVVELHPVAVATTAVQWAEGVHAHPLDVGQALAFDFGRPVSPAWTMAGVGYPLILIPIGPAPRLRMEPCPADAAPVCPLYRAAEPARWWVEYRPAL